LTDDHDARVQSQFGGAAEHYRTSATHARGRSLARLLSLVDPEPAWLVLDVATGAGHTAACLASHVDTVVAGDMTREMLEQAAIVCREQRIENVLFVRENAQALSYRDGVFDLVTCRVAAHHFPAPERFVAESARVLKPRGKLVVVDNIAPDDKADAKWIDNFERRRDPSHAKCLTLDGWRDLYTENGLRWLRGEVDLKWFDFDHWMRRMNVGDRDIELLSTELLDAPQSIQAFWQPKHEDGRVKLALREATMIGCRE